MRDFFDRSILTQKYDKAIFLDRDGTINVDTVMPYRKEHLKLFDDTIVALNLLSKVDAYLIIITNQSGIALGKYSFEEMHNFNSILLNSLHLKGIRIDAIYYCPHYDKKNFPENYHGCRCSKPEPGLLFEAKEDFGIELNKSILIGDKHTDIGAGINAGLRENILVTTGIYKSGSFEQEELANVYIPSYIASNLTEAVKLIIDKSK